MLSARQGASYLETALAAWTTPIKDLRTDLITNDIYNIQNHLLCR